MTILVASTFPSRSVRDAIAWRDEEKGTPNGGIFFSFGDHARRSGTRTRDVPMLNGTRLSDAAGVGFG